MNCAKNPGHATAITMWQNGKNEGWPMVELTQNGQLSCPQQSLQLSQERSIEYHPLCLCSFPLPSDSRHRRKGAEVVKVQNCVSGQCPDLPRQMWMNFHFWCIRISFQEDRDKEIKATLLNASDQISDCTLPSRKNKLKALSEMPGMLRHTSVTKGTVGQSSSCPENRTTVHVAEHVSAKRAGNSARAIRQAFWSTALLFLRLRWCDVLESTRPWFKSWLYHVLALWLWGNYLISESRLLQLRGEDDSYFLRQSKGFNEMGMQNA